MRATLSILIVALTLGCSSEDTPPPPTDTDRDGDGIVDTRDRCPDDAEDVDGYQDADGCPDPGTHLGSLPAKPAQTGVVYVAHYHTTDLRIFRTDNTAPYQETDFDLGVATHDMALDPVNDLLALASDVGKSMNLYSLHRPSGPSEAVSLPTHRAEITYDHVALFVRFNPQRDRLYVVTSTPEPTPPDPITEYWLFAYDVSTPTSPVELTGSPFTIPVTAALDVDFARDLLFLIDYSSKDLYGYDLSGDALTPLPGDPVSLETLFPQTNTWSFSPLNLTVDPWRNRLYAGRHQGALSELIALSYPDPVPFTGTSYASHAGMSDLTVVADGFDVDVDPDSRPNLLGAYMPAVDNETGSIFLSADAWDGTMPSSMMVAMDASLTLATGCDAFEGFGCWQRSYFSGSPGMHQPTDGATCVDATHGVVVGTTYDRLDETLGGGVRFFTYDASLSMSAWLATGDDTLAAGGLPIAAVCH